ncbi:MAG TPA: glycosyltransferase family 2 protein [Actinomycetes bacterium]|nr:glycosyltransferase family 2 protein [Actinomycetes bacterium]
MVEPSLYAVVALYLGIAAVYSILQERKRRMHAAAGPLAPPGPPWPSIDVVLPCYNEDPALLAACCASLEAQDYPGELHVFVVDDGSSNRDALHPVYRRYLRRPGWTVRLLQGNHGKRKAQDVAVSAGSGELVVTVDSDTVFARDGVRRLVGAFVDARVGAVTGDVRVSNAAHNRLTRLIDERYRLLFEHERAAQSQVRSVLCCSGPFSAYRRSALEQVWGDYLTQTFLRRPSVAGDDLHLTNLVLASGYDSLYEPSAKALTNVPTTLRRYLRQQLRWNRSFYRELGPTMRALAERDHYLWLDVGARLLLPLLSAVGIVLAGAWVVLAVRERAEPLPALAGFGMLAVMGLASALLLGRKTSKARFVLLYGLIYLGLLIPVRFWALGTLRQNRWGTRRLARRRMEKRQATRPGTRTPQRRSCSSIMRTCLAAVTLPLRS